MPPEDPEQLLRDVGFRIAELRASKGLTQEHVAELLGIAVRNFQRIERGGQNLTLKTMAAIASVLGVRVIDFLHPPTSREVRIGRPPRASRDATRDATRDASRGAPTHAARSHPEKKQPASRKTR